MIYSTPSANGRFIWSSFIRSLEHLDATNLNNS